MGFISSIFRKIFIIFMVLFLLPISSYADIDLEESSSDFNFEIEKSISTSNNSSIIPNISSKHAIALERTTGRVLFEKSGYEKTPMASTTKIMTAILAIEYGNLNSIITVSKNAALTTGSKLGLKENEKISLSDLLYGLMLRSGNDTAVAIAEHISGSVENFSTLMNQKAQELHMYSSNFVTPNGLDNENHYSTAYDMAILTNYALNNETFCKFVKTKQITISWHSQTITNTNELLGNYPGIYGVKTGFTFGAGRCLISACKDNNLDFIVVVLGADTKNVRTSDSIKILNYIKTNFKMVNLKQDILNNFENYKSYYLKNVEIIKSNSNINCIINQNQNFLFPLSNSEISKINYKTYMLTKLKAPVSKNQLIGIMYVNIDNDLLYELNIYLENEIIVNTFWYYICTISKTFFKI